MSKSNEVSMFKIIIDKAAKTYEIDFAALPPVSQERVIAYGLTQLLGDAAAPIATSASIDGRRVPLAGNDLAKANIAARELVEKRLADLSAGILRRVREGDPVAAEARRIAIRIVNKSDDFRKWLATNGLKAGDKDAVTELSSRAEVTAASPKVIAMAEKYVADMAELDAE
jgi:hypothetical protein